MSKDIYHFVTTGTKPFEIVELDEFARLPAVDGSQLFNVLSAIKRFETKQEMLDYLTNPERFIGQLVTNDEEELLYQLNLSKDEWLEVNGISTIWYNNIEYKENHIVGYNQDIYISLQNNNLNKTPDTETDWWKNITSSEIKAGDGLEIDLNNFINNIDKGSSAVNTHITEINHNNILLEEDITSMLDVGGIDSQELIESGTTFTEFVKKLLLTTFYPTFTDPTFSLTSNSSSNVESGTISNLTLTYNLNRGSINGNIVDGIWVPSAFQNFRTGEVNEYIINGSNTGIINNITISDYQFVDNSNSFSGSVNFQDGEQPKDSQGNDFETPYPSNIVTRSLTITGRRKLFYGVDIGDLTSNNIRSLTNNYLNPTNSYKFNINIPNGSTNVIFAYPNTLRDVSSVKYIEGLNAEIKDIFDLSLVEVEGVNNYLGIDYKVYVYTPVVPFNSSATYEVTI